MKTGDGIILDNEIPPPILVVAGIFESNIEFDRFDRNGGRKRCILTKCILSRFVYLGIHNNRKIYGYPDNGIEEQRLRELFAILNLPLIEQQAIRCEVIRQANEKHLQDLAKREQALEDARTLAATSQPSPQDIASLSLTELDNFRAKFQAKYYWEAYLNHEPFVASLELSKSGGNKELLLICRGYTPLSHDPLTPGAMFASYLSPKGAFAAQYPGTGPIWGCFLIWKSTFTPTQTDLTDALIATRKKLYRLNSMRKFDVYHEIGLPSTENPAIESVNVSIASRSTPSKPESFAPRNEPADSLPTTKPVFPFKPTEQLPKQTVPIYPNEPTSSVVPANRTPSFIPPAAPHRQSMERGVALPMKAILDPVQDAIFRSPLNSRIRISGGPGTGKTTVLLKRLSQKNKFEYLTDEEKELFRGDRTWKEQDWYLFSPSDLLKGYLEKALAKEQLPAGDEHVKVYSTFRNEILRDFGVLRVGKIGAMMFIAGDKEVSSYGEIIDRDYVISFARHLQSYYTKTLQEQVGTAIFELQRIREMVRGQTDHEQYLVAEPILREIEAIERKIGTTVLSEPIRAREFVQRIAQLVDRADSAHLALNRTTVVAGLVKNQCGKLIALKKIRPLEMIFEKVADLYIEFRTTKNPTREQSRNVCAEELDLVFFAILETVHQLWDVMKAGDLRIPGKLKHLMDLLRVNICIDEVTDFSPLEIACMEKFACPKIGGITVCGDLMQRITSRGICNWEQLNIFSKGLAGHELAIAYRQTGKLFAIAKNLFVAKTGLSSVEFTSAYPIQEVDPPALAVRLETVDQIAVWVSDRIFEIFELCGQHLPTIAVLVPESNSIDPIASRLRGLLEPTGIEVDASPNGAFLGNPSRIRVFPVTAIKGLEFEAVFYVDLDIMAKLQPELIDKYVYVGLSRARSFLGVTYRDAFPNEIREISDNFVERDRFSSEHI